MEMVSLPKATLRDTKTAIKHDFLLKKLKIHTHTCIQIHIQTYIETHAHIYTHMCTRVPKYIHIYTRIRVLTHTIHLKVCCSDELILATVTS